MVDFGRSSQHLLQEIAQKATIAYMQILVDVFVDSLCTGSQVYFFLSVYKGPRHNVHVVWFSWPFPGPSSLSYSRHNISTCI